ncbi:MAG: glycosyltransferase [Thermodesulfobacteriota bacterium]
MIIITVVVPFYNAEKYITGCIESLITQRFPAENYEIIFVDNNSTDPSSDIVKRYPRIKLVSESRQSPYSARNKGIEEASGRIVAFTDPDCVAFPDWLAEIEKALSETEVLVVLGQNLMGNDSLLLSMIQDYENEKELYTFSSGDGSIYFGHTNNMAVRREIFDDLGMFIERERGADTIFVNGVVKKYSSRAVEFRESMKVRHMEIEKPLDYYKKVFTYGRSRKLYKHIVNIPPISYSQRLSIYKNVIKKKHYSFPKSAMLFLLLLAGVIFWQAGAMSAGVYNEQLNVRD